MQTLRRDCWHGAYDWPVDVTWRNGIFARAGRRICRNCGATYNLKFKPSKVEGVCEVPTRKVLFNDSYDKREKLVSSGKLKEAIETSILLAKSGDWKNLMTTEDGIILDGVFSTEDWKIFYER